MSETKKSYQTVFEKLNIYKKIHFFCILGGGLKALGAFNAKSEKYVPGYWPKECPCQITKKSTEGFLRYDRGRRTADGGQRTAHAE